MEVKRRRKKKKRERGKQVSESSRRVVKVSVKRAGKRVCR